MKALLLLILLMSGCIFAPIMKGVQDAGLSSGDRAVKLSEELGHFREALYWGQSLKLNKYVLDEGRESFTQAYKGVGRTEKITEVKIDETEVAPDGYSAKVRMLVRYYRIPQYTVLERIDTHDWKYSFNEGWKIASVKLGEEGNTSPLR